ncbi:MAG: hypothetical protein Q6K17_02470, partial [Gloeomargarita sp. GMQP_bins_5]
IVAVDKVWVFVQGSEGTVSSVSLELLSKARELGGSLSAFVAGDGALLAAQLAEFGAEGV